MKTTRIIEIILYVKDMSRMVQFYSEVLDLKLSDPEIRDHSSQDWVTFETETGACLLALHSGSSGDIGKDAPKVVFQVQDIKSARFQLLEAQVSVSEIRSPASGIFVCDARDPEGNPFSLEEKNPT